MLNDKSRLFMGSYNAVKFVIPIIAAVFVGCGGGDSGGGGDKPWIVTPTASEGGVIFPGAPQKVVLGETISFLLTPDDGYQIVSVTGCGGSLSVNRYTTAAFNMDCMVSAAFGPKENNEEGSPLTWNEGDWNEKDWN
jgi:hypothetical protein